MACDHEHLFVIMHSNSKTCGLIGTTVSIWCDLGEGKVCRL